MHTTGLFSVFSISPGTVASEFQSSAGVLLHVPQVWVSLSPDSPSSIFCFNLLQDRAVKDLIFHTVFHQCYHTKLELAWLFLVSHQLWLNGGCPNLFYGPTLLMRSFPLLKCSAETKEWLGPYYGLVPATPSTFHESRTMPLHWAPTRAANAECSKIRMQAGLNGCCCPQSSSAMVPGPPGCHFSFGLLWLCGPWAKWMRFNLCSWTTLPLG